MSTLNIQLLCRKSKKILKLSPFASWLGTIINPQWLEPPMSRTIFYGPKDVRATEVRLYMTQKAIERKAMHQCACQNLRTEESASETQGSKCASRKHAYIILTPLNPTFKKKNGGLLGYHYFSYFCLKHRLSVLVRTASPNECQQFIFRAEIS